VTGLLIPRTPLTQRHGSPADHYIISPWAALRFGGILPIICHPLDRAGLAFLALSLENKLWLPQFCGDGLTFAVKDQMLRIQ
jgi:hypothetical protein